MFACVGVGVGGWVGGCTSTCVGVHELGFSSSPPPHLPSSLPLSLSLTVGESAVGKSSLVLRFVKGQFHEYQESTIGGGLIMYYIQMYILTLRSYIYMHV